MSGLTEAEYEQHAPAELLALRDAIDALPVEGVEAELESDILTLELSDDSVYVINSHRAARQLWMAAGHTAWHFDWVAERGQWVACRTGDELWETLARLLSAQLGQKIALRRPR